jgi:hypothetical protein
MTAEQAAKTVVKATTVAGPRTRYTIGREAALLSRLVGFFPDRMVDRMVASTLRKSAR